MPVVWRKFAVCFILTWALMDLSVPGVCQDDDLESPPADSQAVAVVEQSAVPAIHALTSSPTNNTSGKPGQEDCFCCCSHVAPVQIFSIPSQALVEQHEIPAPVVHQSEYSPFLYRPPRS